MLRILLCILALLAGTRLMAQPVLDSAYAPADDMSITLSGVNFPYDSLVSVPTGQNVYYNYNFNDDTLNHIINIFTHINRIQSGPAIGSTFKCLTYYPTTRVDTFFYVNKPKGFCLKATYNWFGRIGYNKWPPEVPYGLGLNQQRVDTGRFDNSNPSDHYFTVDSTAYVGAGTLRLNGHLFQDVALLHIVRRYYDTTWRETTERKRYYNWLVPGLGIPILQFSFLLVPNPQAWGVGVTYLLDVVVDNKRITHPPLLINPNPAHDYLRVQATGPVHILSATGQSMDFHLSPDGRLDISTLPPGLYTLEAQGRRSRFVKE